MKYFLYIWIVGCSNLNCTEPLKPDDFSSLGDCESALSATLKVNDILVKQGKKPFAGICLPENSHMRIQMEWETDRDAKDGLVPLEGKGSP